MPLLFLAQSDWEFFPVSMNWEKVFDNPLRRWIDFLESVGNTGLVGSG
jgi:hypothetical protein